ncbi:hypothetical protein [Actinophytocola sp.]
MGTAIAYQALLSLSTSSVAQSRTTFVVLSRQETAFLQPGD